MPVLEFHNFITIQTDQVIMVGSIHKVRVVEFVVLAEIHFAQHSALDQKRKRSVNRGARHRRIDLARHGEQTFGRKMFFGAEGGADNRVPLRSVPKPLLPRERVETLLNFRMHGPAKRLAARVRFRQTGRNALVPRFQPPNICENGRSA